MSLIWIGRQVTGPLVDRPAPNDPILEARVGNEAVFTDSATGRQSITNGQVWIDVQASGTELAYAQITSSFRPADATTSVIITDLSLNVAVPDGLKFCVEFYTPQLEQKTGPPGGDLMYLALLVGGVTLQEHWSFSSAAANDGIAAYLRSGTLVGDGATHSFDVAVQNQTTGTNGAWVQAGGSGPCFLRLIAL